MQMAMGTTPLWTEGGRAVAETLFVRERGRSLLLGGGLVIGVAQNLLDKASVAAQWESGRSVLNL